MSTLRVVILGASGFVGQALLRRLADRPDAEVHALIHRSPLAGPADGVTVHSGSITELPPDLLPQAPHVVIHCASKQVDHDGSGFDVNRQGIDALCRAVNPYTRAILYTSSYSVYGDGPQRGVCEELPPRPETPLAQSRLECEQALNALAHSSWVKAVVFRTRFVVGEGDRHFLPGLAKLARSKVDIADGRQRFSVIDVDDYARVMLTVAEQVLNLQVPFEPFEVFNVGYQRPIALAEIREILGEVVPSVPPRIRLPVHEPALDLIEHLPSQRLRQFAQRLRLLGYDHYGDIEKLNRRLDAPLLRADPRDVVRRAAQGLK